VLASHPLFESVLPYYEVDMTRRETGAIVQHFNPLPPADVLAELAEWVRNGHPAIGPIHQVTCERRTAASNRAGYRRRQGLPFSPVCQGCGRPSDYRRRLLAMFEVMHSCGAAAAVTQITTGARLSSAVCLRRDGWIV